MAITRLHSCREVITDIHLVAAELASSPAIRVISTSGGDLGQSAHVYFAYLGARQSEADFFARLGLCLTQQSRFMAGLHISWVSGYEGTIAKLEVSPSDLRTCAEWLRAELQAILPREDRFAYVS